MHYGNGIHGLVLLKIGWDYWMENDKAVTRITLLEKLTVESNDFAWQEFKDYYSGFIKSVLYRSGVSSADLDDLFQEVMLKIWKSISKYSRSRNSKFRSWLGVVIRNVAYDWYKKHGEISRKTQELVVDQSGTADFEKIIEDEWKTYITDLAWKNISVSLSDKMLKVMELVMSGESNEAVSQKMKMKKNTVAVYKKRATMALYREISRLDYELNH